MRGRGGQGGEDKYRDGVQLRRIASLRGIASSVPDGSHLPHTYTHVATIPTYSGREIEDSSMEEEGVKETEILSF